MKTRKQGKLAMVSQGRLLMAACCVMLTESARISLAAEDPSRFVAVTNWYATFTRTMQGSGTQSDICTKTYSSSHSGSLSTQLKFVIVGGDQVLWAVGPTNISLNYSIDDRTTETCPFFPPTNFRARSAPSMQVEEAVCVLMMNLTEANYTLDIDFRFGPYIFSVNGADDPPGGDVDWIPRDTVSQNPIREPLPLTGMIIQGSRRYTLNRLSTGDSEVFSPGLVGVDPSFLNGELVLSWTLSPFQEELEVVIEPIDYQEWLPKGDLKDWNTPGDVLFVRAALQTTDGQVPQSRAKRFKYELLEVSKEKGVCLNRPSKSRANDANDLRMPADLNMPPIVDIPWSISNGGLTATTPDGNYDVVEAAVASYDFGAHGKLKVTAEVGGEEIVGYLNTDGMKRKEPILIPRRQPNSEIADQWKEDRQATGKPDSADDEDIPAGDGHNGDGLSLYEEYRGFSENGKHIRANPLKKDFFVADGIRNLDSSGGIGTFAKESGLEVHSKMRGEEFDVDLTSPSVAVQTTINFNHGTEHKIDQHGIMIVERDVSTGLSFADGDDAGGTPGRYQRVWIDPAVYGWQTLSSPNGSRAIRLAGAGTVAHELAHTCAVWHHGDEDETVTWRAEEVVANGRTNVVVTEDGVIIDIRLEDGRAIEGYSDEVWIGYLQGQHSGDQDCLMRYACAEAYPRGNIRYLVEGQEPEGFHFCTSSAGTGVNAANRPLGSRYGAALRGNCKAQICVNDVYNGSHSR